MTSTASEAASYEFTTLTCIPGVIEVSMNVFVSLLYLSTVNTLITTIMVLIFFTLVVISTKGQTFNYSIYQESLRVLPKVPAIYFYKHNIYQIVYWCLDVHSGKGRGRQVIAVARTADVVVMMLDATKGDVQRCVRASVCVQFEFVWIFEGVLKWILLFFNLLRDLLEKELESVGIRLNRRKPNIYFKVLSWFYFSKKVRAMNINI